MWPLKKPSPEPDGLTPEQALGYFMAFFAAYVLIEILCGFLSDIVTAIRN
jgi:hypothetical protein